MLHVGLGLGETRLCNGKTFGVSLSLEHYTSDRLRRRSILGTCSLLDLRHLDDLKSTLYCVFFALIIHLSTAVFAGLMYVCTLQLHMQVRSFRKLYLASGKDVDTFFTPSVLRGEYSLFDYCLYVLGVWLVLSSTQ
jgi:hypothetical protein